MAYAGRAPVGRGILPAVQARLETAIEAGPRERSDTPLGPELPTEIHQAYVPQADETPGEASEA